MDRHLTTKTTITRRATPEGPQWALDLLGWVHRKIHLGADDAYLGASDMEELCAIVESAYGNETSSSWEQA